MADGRLEQAREFRQFVNWFNAQYGTGAWFWQGEINRQNFRESPQYKYWVQQGKPGSAVKEGKETPYYELTPEQKGELLYDPARHPYPRPSEAEWYWNWQNIDPETGEPTRGQWGRTPFPEGATVVDEGKVIREGPSPTEEKRIGGYTTEEWASGWPQFEQSQREWRERMDWEKQMWQSELAGTNVKAENLRTLERATNLERLRRERTDRLIQGQQVRVPTDIDEEERKTRKIFEMLIAGLGGDINWMQRAQLEERYNQALAGIQMQKGTGTESQARYWEDTRKLTNEEVKLAANRYGKAIGELYWAQSHGGLIDKEYAETALLEAKEELKAAKEHRQTVSQTEKMWKEVAQEEYASQTMPLGGGDVSIGRGVGTAAWVAANQPQAEKTPAWLAPIIGKQAGQPLTTYTNWQAAPLAQAAPLSGQAWSRLQPSQVSQLSSYLRAAGQKPEDYFAVSQSMLPRTPRTAGGWRPSQQRV